MRFSDIEPGKHALTEAPIREPALVVDPDKEMDRKEIYNLLNKYKETLGPKISNILDLWADGESYRSIGKKLSLSPERIRQIIDKGLAILGARMNMAVDADAGHLYGFRKKEKNYQHHGYTHSPAQLYKTISDNPNLKIINVGTHDNRFTVVPRSDPRREVIHDPNHSSTIARMESDLETYKGIKSDLYNAALRMDGGGWDATNRVQLRPATEQNRRELMADPAYINLKTRIADLEEKIPALKKRGNWYDAPKTKANEAEVWDNPNPKKKHKKLSPEKKAAAKARAKRAGRPYPNLIDNMWASKK